MLPKQQLYIATGGIAYKGSLNPNYGSFSPGFEIGLALTKKKRFNSCISVYYGSVKGERSNPIKDLLPGTSTIPGTDFFTSNLLAFRYELRYNFWVGKKTRYWASAGFGLLRYNPMDQTGRAFINQPTSRLPGETYDTRMTHLPVFAGGSYRFNNGWSALAQVGLWNLRGAYLDNTDKHRPEAADNLLQIRVGLQIPLKTKSETAPTLQSKPDGWREIKDEEPENP